MGKTDSLGTATYRRDGVDVTSPVLSDGSATYTPGISERRSGTTTYELNDRLGTGSRQTSTSATTTATRTYDAFGMLVSSTGTFKGPFGFAGAHGYQEDGDSGLQLLGHRYYDPSTGRFLTRDPVKDGRNWYAYCRNNPQKNVDADGYQFDVGVYIKNAWRAHPRIHDVIAYLNDALELDISDGQRKSIIQSLNYFNAHKKMFERAEAVASQIRKNGRHDNLKGPEDFRNDDRKLPKKGKYVKYDVYPARKGQRMA